MKTNCPSRRAKFASYSSKLDRKTWMQRVRGVRIKAYKNNFLWYSKLTMKSLAKTVCSKRK